MIHDPDLKFTRDTPYLTLVGELIGELRVVYRAKFGEQLPRYSGTTPYIHIFI